MAHYVQLLTLTPEGRRKLLEDPECVLQAANAVRQRDVTILGLYAVLGSFDFVSIVEAPDNEAVARYSIEFGVRADVHITTLPAVPVALLQGTGPSDVPFEFSGVSRDVPPEDEALRR